MELCRLIYDVRYSISRSVSVLGTVAFVFLMSSAYAAIPNKTLVYCSEANPEGFDPAQSTTSVVYTASAFTVHNRLVEFVRGTTNIEPGLAERWEISPDGLSYTFYLQRGVQFHTTPYFKPTREFNADDVLFTFERMRDLRHPFRAAFPASFPYFTSLGLDKEIEKIEKLDPYTVRFVLKSVNAPFLMNLGLAFASILSAEYAEKLLAEGRAVDITWKPIGTGPFIFSSYTKDTAIYFDGNPNYWKQGDVQVSKLVFAITLDPAVRLEKFKLHECEVMGYPRPSQLASIEADPSLTLLSQPGLNISYLAYNISHKPLDDVLVRRALDMAINKKAIIDSIFHGQAQIATAPMAPAVWSYDDTLENAPYDFKKAKALLAQAGYPKGFSISLWAMPVQSPYNPNAQLMAAMIQEDWKKIGVKAKIISYERGEYLKRARAGEHDAMLIGWTGNSDPDDWLGVLLTCDAKYDNYSKWCNPLFDDLIKKGRQTIDPARREIFYKRAQKIFKHELPFTPIAHAFIYQPINRKVTNFKINPLCAILFMGVGLE